MLTATTGLTAASAGAATVGGDVAGVTDYIFRGVSQTDGHGAAQFDLHAGTNDGLFAGVWGSTLTGRYPRADGELQLYAGKRFQPSSEWSATLAAIDYSYLNRATTRSDDYQELSASLSYLDTWTFSVAASPNAIRYWRGYRLGRYPAYDADLTVQWPLVGPVLLTGGAGYYRLTGPIAPGAGAPGYAYGSAGVALERRAWRLDVGYYFADSQAERLFPYSLSNDRLAATLSWRF